MPYGVFKHKTETFYVLQFVSTEKRLLHLFSGIFFLLYLHLVVLQVTHFLSLGGYAHSSTRSVEAAICRP